MPKPSEAPLTEAESKAIDLAPGTWQLHYNLACAYSLLSAALARGERPVGTDHNPAAAVSRAIRALEEAGRNGFTNWRTVTVDPDFDGIRNHPDFIELLRRRGITPR